MHFEKNEITWCRRGGRRRRGENVVLKEKPYVFPWIQWFLAVFNANGSFLRISILLIENYEVNFDFFERIFGDKSFFLHSVLANFAIFFQIETLRHMFLRFKIWAQSRVSRNFFHLVFAVSLLHLDYSIFFRQSFLC